MVEILYGESMVDITVDNEKGLVNWSHWPPSKRCVQSQE